MTAAAVTAELSFTTSDWYKSSYGPLAAVPVDQLPDGVSPSDLSGKRVMIDGRPHTVRSVRTFGEQLPDTNLFGLIARPVKCRCTSIVRDDNGRLQCLTHGDVTGIHTTDTRHHDHHKGWTSRID